MFSVTLARYGLAAGLATLLTGAFTAAEGNVQTQTPVSSRPAPPRRLPPNRVQPGGGLDEGQQACSDTADSLTALIPVENPVMTALSHPSFWFYIPDGSTTVASAELIVLSADEREQIYASQVDLPDTPGFLRLQLPSTLTPGLAEDTYYRWYFNVTCHSQTVLSVNGWIQRATGSDTTARHWYDDIDQTAMHLLEAPQNSNAQQAWADLLTEIELSHLLNEPVLDTAHTLDLSEPVAN